MTGKPSPSRIREINDSIRYAMWSVFAVTAPLGDNREVMAKEVEELFARLESEGVVTRGVYDVGGLRAEADFMVWWHAERIEDVQAAYRALLRTELGQLLEPTWSAAALHRPAEFNKSHIPAFLADEQPKDFICVYPFVRSYDWYLLDDKERRDMLREHGQQAREYPDVRANTIAVVRPGRLRVGAGLRGRRAAPHRRPHARAARLTRPDARPRRGAVPHRAPGRGRRAARLAALRAGPTSRSGAGQALGAGSSRSS